MINTITKKKSLFHLTIVVPHERKSGRELKVGVEVRTEMEGQTSKLVLHDLLKLLSCTVQDHLVKDSQWAGTLHINNQEIPPTHTHRLTYSAI